MACSRVLSDHCDRAAGFVCSLSGLNRCPAHYATGTASAPTGSPCRLGPWSGHSLCTSPLNSPTSPPARWITSARHDARRNVNFLFSLWMEHFLACPAEAKEKNISSSAFSYTLVSFSSPLKYCAHLCSRFPPLFFSAEATHPALLSSFLLPHSTSKKNRNEKRALKIKFRSYPCPKPKIETWNQSF